MAMMISWVAPVNPSHPYLENDPAPSFDRNICAFHLGFSLVFSHVRNESFRKAPWKTRHVDARSNFKNDPCIPSMTDY